MTILLGNGDGTLNEPIAGYALGGEATVGAPSGAYGWYNAAIVADFDGDGFVDILVPDPQFSLAFLKGYNDASFRAAPGYYAPGTLGPGPAYGNAKGIASGDFNGDGIPDIVIAGAGVLMLSLLPHMACGGGNNPASKSGGTSGGAYTIVVTDSAAWSNGPAGLQHSTNVVLTVQ